MPIRTDERASASSWLPYRALGVTAGGLLVILSLAFVVLYKLIPDDAGNLREAVDPSVHVITVEVGESECFGELFMEGPPVANFVAVQRHLRCDHASTIPALRYDRLAVSGSQEVAAVEDVGQAAAGGWQDVRDGADAAAEGGGGGGVALAVAVDEQQGELVRGVERG